MEKGKFNIGQLKKAIERTIWDVETRSLPWWKRWPIRVLRVVYVVVRDFTDGQLTLQAMSLVYTTLLALVPLLAVSFSILKGFGVHNEIEPLLLNFLKPLGDRGLELGTRIIGFVDNVKAGILGSVGLALLIYTVISLLQKIERAFNYTWRVKRSRPLAQRFSDYLSVIVIAPVLIFTALGLTASLMSNVVVQKLLAIQIFGSLLTMGTKLLPYLLTIAAFTFVYVFVPNTKVRIGSAFTGALVAGTLWETAGWGFASFVAGSTKYTAIYSGFAILLMFMIWVYVSWLILLVGASVAFYHQRPDAIKAYRRELRLSNRLKEKLSLLVMLLVGQNYYHNEPPWTTEGLTQRLRLPLEVLEPILETLEKSGFLTPTGDEPPSYLPARPPETTELAEVLGTVRGTQTEEYFSLQTLPPELAAEDAIAELDQAMEKALEGQTLKDLALSDSPPVALVNQPSQQETASSGDNK
jgi:membrane protein